MASADGPSQCITRYPIVASPRFPSVTPSPFPGYLFFAARLRPCTTDATALAAVGIIDKLVHNEETSKLQNGVYVFVSIVVVLIVASARCTLFRVSKKKRVEA